MSGWSLLTRVLFMTVRREIAQDAFLVKRILLLRGTRETCEKSGIGRKFHVRESRLSRMSSLPRSPFTSVEGSSQQ